MSKIKIYYHVTPQPYWTEFYQHKIELMKSVGLWDAAEKISICLHYEPGCVEEIKQYVGPEHKVEFIFNLDSVRPYGEQYTNLRLKDDCDNFSSNYYIFRLHNKGINHYNTVNWPANKIIAEEMDYNTINRWQDCVIRLEQGYDAVGVNWVRQPWPHFKGNYWWAQSDYIKRISRLIPPHENGMKQQILGGGWTIHDAESWIGTGNPRAYDILRETDEIGDHPDL